MIMIMIIMIIIIKKIFFFFSARSWLVLKGQCGWHCYCQWRYAFDGGLWQKGINTNPTAPSLLLAIIQ